MRSRRWRENIVRVVAGYERTHHRETLSLLNALPILLVANIEHGAEKRRLRFGSAKVHRVGERHRGAPEAAPVERRDASDRSRSQIRVVLGDPFAEDGYRRKHEKAAENRLTESRTQVIVELPAERVRPRLRTDILQAAQGLAYSDLRYARREVEATGSVHEIVIRQLASDSEAVERSVPAPSRAALVVFSARTALIVRIESVGPAAVSGSSDTCW